MKPIFSPSLSVSTVTLRVGIEYKMFSAPNLSVSTALVPYIFFISKYNIYLSKWVRVK